MTNKFDNNWARITATSFEFVCYLNITGITLAFKTAVNFNTTSSVDE